MSEAFIEVAHFADLIIRETHRSCTSTMPQSEPETTIRDPETRSVSLSSDLSDGFSAIDLLLSTAQWLQDARVTDSIKSSKINPWTRTMSGAYGERPPNPKRADASASAAWEILAVRSTTAIALGSTDDAEKLAC